MRLDREQALVELGAHLDREWALWDMVMQTGDTSAVEATIPEEAVCYFAAQGMTQAEYNDRAAIIAGMRESVAALKGCRKRFENRLIRMRSAEEGVVFFEQVVENGARVLARLLTMETYRRTDGQWRCIREIVEHAGA